VIKAYLQPDEKTPEKVAEKPAAHYDAPLAIGEKGSVNPRPAHSMTP
jgi:penicillin-binding protein 2